MMWPHFYIVIQFDLIWVYDGICLTQDCNELYELLNQNNKTFIFDKGSVLSLSLYQAPVQLRWII